MISYKKYIPCLIVIWLGGHFTLSAQSDRYLDKVTLTNGTVMWGISEIEDKAVRVYIDDETSVSVPDSLIKSLKTQKLNPKLYLQRETGVYYELSTGLLVGKGNHSSENETSFTARFTSGYKFHRQFGLGLGLGVDFYPRQRHIPLFVDIQGNLLSGRVTPYYQLSTGWSWAEDRDSNAGIDRLQGGFFIRPGFGVKWHFPKHTWHLQLSYSRQNSTTYYAPIDFGNGNILTNVEERVLQRMGISVGIAF